MAEEIDQRVEVQARTDQGQIVPVLVTWNQKTYPVTQVRQRRMVQAPGRQAEILTVSVIEVRKMRLEYEHNAKTWHLLSIE